MFQFKGELQYFKIETDIFKKGIIILVLFPKTDEELWQKVLNKIKLKVRQRPKYFDAGD